MCVCHRPPDFPRHDLPTYTGADNNKLRLIFTQLDSSNPSREFFFSVHIDEADHYMVVRACTHTVMVPRSIHRSTPQTPYPPTQTPTTQQEECQPPLDAALVGKLVKEVNASNDFAAFVKAMRRAFKGTVKPN